MPELSIPSAILSIYGESAKLIQNRLDGPGEGERSSEGILSDIIRKMFPVVDAVVEERQYSYCEAIKEASEYLMKLALSLPGFKKIESTSIVAEMQNWVRKDVHSENRECEEMLQSFRSMLGELLP